MKKIENEKKRTAEVEAEIDQVEKEVAMQRKTMGGVKLAEQVCESRGRHSQGVTNDGN